jgi:hypothetical protein
LVAPRGKGVNRSLAMRNVAYLWGQRLEQVYSVEKGCLPLEGVLEKVFSAKKSCLPLRAKDRKSVQLKRKK